MSMMSMVVLRQQLSLPITLFIQTATSKIALSKAALELPSISMGGQCIMYTSPSSICRRLLNTRISSSAYTAVPTLAR